MEKPKSSRRWHILAVAAVAMSLVAVVGMGLYMAYDLFEPFAEKAAFRESLPLGMSMVEVREIYGDPDKIIEPGESPPSHRNQLGPRDGDTTTVWYYFLIGRVSLLDGVYLYFNEEEELVRVELIHS